MSKELDLETKIEAVAAMLCDEIEEIITDDPEFNPHDGLPLEARKCMVQLIYSRFHYFYALDREPKDTQEVNF